MRPRCARLHPVKVFERRGILIGRCIRDEADGSSGPAEAALVVAGGRRCRVVRHDAEFFAQEGHHLDCAYNGREGLTAALNGAYDLVILDVMLPVVDGFELLQRLRRRKDLPIIMLTARVQQQDRIRGLDCRCGRLSAQAL